MGAARSVHQGVVFAVRLRLATVPSIVAAVLVAESAALSVGELLARQLLVQRVSVLKPARHLRRQFVVVGAYHVDVPMLGVVYARCASPRATAGKVFSQRIAFATDLYSHAGGIDTGDVKSGAGGKRHVCFLGKCSTTHMGLCS